MANINSYKNVLSILLLISISLVKTEIFVAPGSLSSYHYHPAPYHKYHSSYNYKQKPYEDDGHTTEENETTEDDSEDEDILSRLSLNSRKNSDKQADLNKKEPSNDSYDDYETNEYYDSIEKKTNKSSESNNEVSMEGLNSIKNFLKYKVDKLEKEVADEQAGETNVHSLSAKKGPMGEKGARGDRGPQGERGPAGEKGDKGDSGAQLEQIQKDLEFVKHEVKVIKKNEKIQNKLLDLLIPN